MDCFRWNFDADEAALLVCRNDHEKGDDCDMQPMHPAEVLALVTDLRARVMNAEAKEASAVAAERERLKARAHSRAGYEAAAAAHHAGKWQPAFEMHMTRNAAMCDLIDALFGPNVGGNGLAPARSNE